MTAPRDPNRLIHAFLTEGKAELPDRTYDAVRAHIDRTRQRVVIGPWRERRMSIQLRLAIAAAAVVVVAVIGINFLPGRVSGPGASPTPTAEPSPSPTALAYTWPNPILAGTYSTEFTWDVPFAVTLTVPDGWESRDIEVVRDPVLTVAFALVGNVYADPCAHVLQDPPLGPSVDDLADAIASLPGVDATAPTAVTLAGYTGKYVEFSVRSDSGCLPSQVLVWSDPEGSHLPVGPLGPPTWGAERPNSRVWILDVKGERFVVSALWSSTATPADLAELQAVVDSIRIGQPVRPLVVSSCTLEVSSPAGGGAAIAEPYVATLGATTYEKLGPVPSPFPVTPPSAQLNFTGNGWSGRPGARLIPPDGTTKAGFATTTTVGGFQGSLVFDAPGMWWARVTSSEAGCLRQFPIEVRAQGPG
jgi:hypothetical protein